MWYNILKKCARILKKLLTEIEKIDIITFSIKKEKVQVGGSIMESILTVQNLKFNIFLVDISFDFSFKNILYLKFINYFIK